MTDVIIADRPPWLRVVAEAAVTTYGFDFVILHAADLRVYINDALVTSGYTVSGVYESGGGSVVFDTPVPYDDDDVLTLMRDTPLSRAASYAASGPIKAEDINRDLNALVAMVQESAWRLGRTLELSPTDAADAGTLPPAADRAGKIILFDDAGNAVAEALITAIDDALGSDNWQQSGEIAAGAVSSVFGRAGNVTAASGDYTADQIAETASRAFVTPSEKSKLGGVESGATADQTGSEIGTLLDALLTHTGWRVDATAAAMTTATDPSAWSFVSADSDLSTATAKLATRAAVKSAIDTAVGSGGTVIKLDVSSGGALTNNKLTILTTAGTTQTVTLPPSAAESQHVRCFNETAVAQTIQRAATGSDTLTARPGDSSVTAFRLPPGGFFEAFRAAGSTDWKVVYAPPAFLPAMALVGDMMAPVAALGTLSSPHTPTVAEGLLCTGALSGDVTINVPTGDPPAGAYTRKRYVLTASTAAEVSLHASYGQDGAPGDLTWTAGETKSIEWEYDGSTWIYIGVLVPELVTIGATDVALKAMDQTAMVTGTGVADLPPTSALAGPTFILIVKTASGDRTMTLQSGSDAFSGSAIVTDAAPIACFFAAPGDTTWYRV